MSCCGARVIVDPAQTPSPSDDNITYFLSSFQTQTGINLYQSNATLNTTSNLSFVQTPYGLIRPDSNYGQSFYEIFPQPGTSSIRTACFNYVDSNSNATTRTFGFVKEFLSTPLVFLTPANGTACNIVFPHLQNVYTTGIDYGMWDFVTSNYTTDLCAIMAKGIIDDRSSLISSNYDSNYYPIQGSSNFGSFITSADLDPAYPATINWLFSYEYQSGPGPEFGTVLNTDIANINNGVAKSFPTFPPSSNPYPGYASYSSNATFSVSLLPNTQYYVWWYIAYPEVMGNILSYLDITYHSKI